MNKRQAICECFKLTGVQSLKRSGVTRRSDNGGLRCIKKRRSGVTRRRKLFLFFRSAALFRHYRALLLVPERLGKGHFLFGDV